MKSQKFPVFLINLKKRPERLISSIRELSKVKLSEYIIRKEGSDEEKSKRLKYEYITREVVDNIENNLVSTHILPTWGAVGCAISHIEIWKLMIEDNIKFALIMEDDNYIYNVDKFNWVLHAVLKKMRKSEYNSYFISLNSKTGLPNKKFIDNNLYIPTDFFTGLSFYFINYCAAKDFLKRITTIRMQLDFEISNIFLNNNSLEKMKIQIYDDSGVKTNNLFSSDVQFYFWETEELYFFFNIPFEIAEKIHFFLPQKNLINIDYNLN